MGSGNSTDYRSEIDRGLSEANQPKSALAQNISNVLGNQAGSAYSNLANQTASATPGKVLNAGLNDPRLTQSGTPNYSQFQTPFFGNSSGNQGTNQTNYSPYNQQGLVQQGAYNPAQQVQGGNQQGINYHQNLYQPNTPLGSTSLGPQTNQSTNPQDIYQRATTQGGSAYNGYNDQGYLNGDRNQLPISEYLKSINTPGSSYQAPPGYSFKNGSWTLNNTDVNALHNNPAGSGTMINGISSTGNYGVNAQGQPGQYNPAGTISQDGSYNFGAGNGQGFQIQNPNFNLGNGSFGIQNIQAQNTQGGNQQSPFQPTQGQFGNVDFSNSASQGLQSQLNGPGQSNLGLGQSIQNALGYQNQGINSNQILAQLGQHQNLNSFNALGANLQDSHLGGLNPNVNFQQQNLNPFQAQQTNLQNINQPSSVIQDSQYSKSLQDILNNQHNLNLADTRARFGAEGGNSRGTAASYAEAQLNSQEMPQIAAALGQARQQEAQISGNLYNTNVNAALQNTNQQNSSNLQGRGQDLSQLQSNQQGNLQAQQSTLQNLLTGRGQDLNSLQNNNQNQLQNVSQLNQSNLQGRGQNIDAFNQGRNQDLGFLNAGINNNQTKGGLNNQLLSTLLGNQNQQQGLNNQAVTDNNNTNLQRLLGLGGLNNQGVSNQLNQRGQNIQNYQSNQSNNMQQNQFGLQDLQQQLQYALGQGSQNNSNAQFNAGQTNQLNQNYVGQGFQSQQDQISRQANAYNQLAGYLTQIGALGYPGGSANINVSPIANQSGLGSTLGGLGQLAGALGGLRSGG